MSAYWICVYKAVHDPDKVAAYAELAGPGPPRGRRSVPRPRHPRGDLRAGRGRPAPCVIEFESVEAAVAAHDSEAYQEALRALGDGADRDLRVVPGA